jgi:hypothetical protein
MVDIYSALIGEPPTDQEKLKALAEKLRGRSMIGQLGQITGDKVLAPMGAGISKQTEDQAGQIGQWTANIRNRAANAQLARDSQAARAAEGALDREFTGQQNALQRALQLELEKMQQGRYASADAKAEAANKKDLDKYAERYGKEIGKAELPALESYISDADAILSKYDGKSIPGIGFMDFKARMTQEGSDARQGVQAVQNAMLKALSGAAVTESEAERLQTQMFGPLATEESFRKGWASLKRATQSRRENIERAYPTEALELYESRGKKPGGAAAPASKNPEDYATYEEYLDATQ